MATPVNTTIIRVEGMDSITVPNMAMTEQQVRQQLSATPGVTNMACRVEDVNGIRTLHFTNRTGTKG